MARRREEELDAEELGRTIEILYEAFNTIESVGGSLSPFVPTQEYIEEPLVALLEAFMERAGLSTPGPVFYEPGCGTARITRRLAQRGYYALCLELDEELAEMARRNTESLVVDVVQGDLASFRPRRVGVAYAYLLPRAVARLLETLRGLGTIIISLDYPAEGDRGHIAVAKLRVMHRDIYVMRT